MAQATLLQTTFKELRQKATTDADLILVANGGLSPELEQVAKKQGHQIYRGKVRDLVIREHDILMLHSDRLTAFDRFIAQVPYKGFILASISAWWFLQYQKAGGQSHFLEFVNPWVLRSLKLRPIKAEVVVRGYLAGSLLRAYQKGERSYCGTLLPDKLLPYAALPNPIITPTTKADAFEHDENSSPEQLIAAGVCSEAEWRNCAGQALELFKWGSEIARQRGWILADTKYEFGRARDGAILIMDEIHTPDSSRFWRQVSFQSRLAAGQPPEMFDKENIRRHLLAVGFQGIGPVPEVPVPLLMDLADVYLTFAESLLNQSLTTPDPLPSHWLS